MRLIAILIAQLLLTLNVYGFGQVDSCGYNKITVIKSEIKQFIDTISDYRSTRLDFNVFVVRFYHLQKDNKDISFTLGYIKNQNDFFDVNADYYFNIGDKFVIVRIPDKSFLNLLNNLDLKKISSFDREESKVRILQKLYPNGAGFLSYGSSCVVISLNDCSINKEFFKNSNLIPSNVSIRDNLDNIVVDILDSADFTENILRKGKKLDTPYSK